MGGTMQDTTLPAGTPDWVVLVCAAAALALWMLLHFRLSAAGGTRRALTVFLTRTLVGALAVWLALSALSRVVALRGSWPAWTAALLGAVAVETTLLLYALERRTVSRRAGLALAGLRLSLALLVLLILVQPVLSHDLRRTFQRYVAVLVDQSASMYLIDHQASATEKLHLLRLLQPDSVRVPRPFDLDQVALERVRQELAAQADWLALLQASSSDTITRQLETRRDPLRRLLQRAVETADRELKVLAAVSAPPAQLDRETASALKDLETVLAARVREPVAASLRLLTESGVDNVAARQPQLLLQIRAAESALKEFLARLPDVTRRIDDAHFAALPESERKEIDRIALRSREAIARAVLLTPRAQAPCLLDALDSTYLLRLYTFAATPAPADAPAWRNATDPTAPPDQIVEKDAASRSTDLAAAMDRVLADVPPERLAGILVLSDGRHNARAAVDTVARRLGTWKAAVCSVLVGSSTPPPDAAVTGIVAPQSVYVEDKLVIEASVRFDRLRTQEARVRLTRDNQTIDEKTFLVPSDNFRASVALTDTPKDKGVHTYQLEIVPFRGETFLANNTRPVHVTVIDDRTRLLIVEGRPRWEFRYLRNLFANRDKTVVLRHVLLTPDLIAGQESKTLVHASVSTADAPVEASALPENEAEWMKFDVIVLGDVSPEIIGDKELQILQKFVGERGGTLIVIAGPWYMPHAYGNPRLRELLPFTYDPAPEPVFKSPEPAFRITVTDAGRDHVILRQSDTPDETLRIWDSLPDVDWRHAIKDTKPGAVVLAYATPQKSDAATTPEPAPRTGPADAQKLQRQFERSHALIALQKFGVGQVLALTFDRTWRLRYEIGDTYHHKFWGQVLRWATAQKLQAGTEFVRLGTERFLYAPGDVIRVQARVTGQDKAGAPAPELAVSVYDGNRLVRHRKLDPVPESGGIYEGDLGALDAPGRYRVELETPDSLKTSADGKKIETEIVVAPTPSGELVELAADRSILDRAARLTAGAVAQPADAFELLPRFGLPTQEVREERLYTLWNSWPLFLIIVCVATGEWVLRKKVGLL